MPKKRNRENAGFPTGWRWMNGAIRYHVPKGCEKYWDGKKQFTLGKTLNEAYATWSKRLGNDQEVITIGDLLQRYYREISRQKPPQSIKSDTRAYKELTKAFHNVRIDDITPQDIYKYIDKRSAKISARREKSMLSHAYTKAVEWGYINKHPFKGEVRLEGEKARTRFIEDWEIAEIMNMNPHRNGDIIVMIQAYIGLKLVIPIRKGDMLRLNVNKFTDQGIPVTTGKTGKKTIYEWTPERLAAVEACKNARPKDICQWLFCNRLGNPYFNEEKGTTSGFDSVWQRFMDRVLAETRITERFTEHDLRAKAGSDAESKERAKELLGHDRVETTVRAYRRKPEVIK